MHVIAR